MTKQVKVHLTDGYRTVMETRGHTWYADEPGEDGGDDSAPTPMEEMLGALGACTAITVRMYALRKGWPLEGIEIDVTLEKYKKADYPAYNGDSDVVNELRQSITLLGPLTDDQKARLLEIAGKCPVHKVLTQPNFLIEELANPEATIAE